MKTKKKVLIGLMALCLAGAAGTTFALTRNGATGTGTAGAFDQAIYLNWGSDQSSVSIDAVSNMLTNVAQYRRLSVMPKSTKTVAGTVTVTFTLAADTGCHINGLSVAVYRLNALPASDAAAETAVSSETPVFTLATTGVLVNTNTITVEAAAAAHESSAYYVMKFNWDGSRDGQKNMQGTLTVSQAFAAKAA